MPAQGTATDSLSAISRAPNEGLTALPAPLASRQQCEPSFGAIPSTKDMKKKQEEQAEAEEKRDEILTQIVRKEALERLSKVEVVNPAKAEQVKDQILAKRSYWRLNGPVTDEHVKQLLAEAEQASDSNTRGVALDRRRFGDDDDSDVSLDGL